MNPSRRPRAAVTLALTLFLLATSGNAQAAAGGKIRAIGFDQASRTFHIDASTPIRAEMNTLSIAGRQRIIIDVENAELGTELPRDVQLVRQLSQNMPGLRNITTHQYGGVGNPMVRILLDMDGTSPPLRLVRNQGPQVELLLSKRINGVSATPVPSNRIQPNSTPHSPWFPPNTGPIAPLESAKKNHATPQSPAAMPDWKTGQSDSLSLQSYPATPYKPSKTVTSRPSQSILPPLQATSKMQSQTQPDAPESEKPASDEVKRALVNLNQRYIQLLDENKQLKAHIQSVQTQGSQTSEQQGQQLAKLLEDNKSLLQQNQSLESRLKKNGDRKDATQQLHALQQENSQLGQQLKTLQDQEIKKQAEQDRTIQELKQGNAELSQQLATAHGAGNQNQAQEQVKRLQDENARLSQQMETLRLNGEKSAQQAAATKEQNIKRLQDENTQLGKELKSLQAKLAKREEKGVRASDTQTQQLAAQNKQLSEQLATLRSQNESGKSELQKQLQTAQEENQALRTQLANPKKAGPSTATVAPSELTSMRKQVTVAQASLNEAIKTINEQNKEVAFLRSQIADVKNGTDGALRQQIDRLQAELTEKNTKIQTLETQAGELKKVGSKNASAKTASASPALASLQQEVASLKQKLLDAQQDNAELNRKLSTASTTAMPVGSESGIPLDTSPGVLDAAERHYQAGKAALSSKNMSQATSELREASDKAPNNGRYAVDYANALADSQQMPAAVATLTQYLQKNPNDREAYTQLGKLYLLNDQPEPAVQAFNRALPVGTLNNYASALKKTNRPQDAESVFKLALTLNPKDSEVLFNLGNLYNSTGKTAQARDYYQKALQSRPNFPEAHYNLGLIYAKLGDKTQAISHLEQFLKLSPNAKNADTIKAYIEKLKA